MPTSSRGSRRDLAALEARRFQAAEMFARGESQAAVARGLGVTTAAANHWYQAWQAKGRRGLKAAGRAGRKPRLGPTDLAKLDRALRAGPTAHGFATEVWTLPRVATIVEEHALAAAKKRRAAAGLARLRGRTRRLAAPGSPSHVGAARRNPDARAHGWELETPVGRWSLGVSLGGAAEPVLLPHPRWHVHRSGPGAVRARAEARFSRPPGRPDLGRLGRSQELLHDSVPEAAADVAHGGAVAGVCPGVESAPKSCGTGMWIASGGTAERANSSIGTRKRRKTGRTVEEFRAQARREHSVADVDAALEQLPVERCLVLLLIDGEGMRYDEVAQVMECPVGTVRSRLHRGRRVLWQTLLGVWRSPASG